MIHANFLTITITIFILFLQKGVYHYENTDHWEKFNKTSFLEKEDSYSHINMEDNTDAVYGQALKICKDFEIQNLGQYYDLYVQRFL